MTKLVSQLSIDHVVQLGDWIIMHYVGVLLVKEVINAFYWTLENFSEVVHMLIKVTI